MAAHRAIVPGDSVIVVWPTSGSVTRSLKVMDPDHLLGLVSVPEGHLVGVDAYDVWDDRPRFFKPEWATVVGIPNS